MTIYHICLKGHVDPRWKTLFAGFTLTHHFASDQQPITVMTGAVVDQAALYGLISRLRDLGATLISLQPQEAD